MLIIAVVITVHPEVDMILRTNSHEDITVQTTNVNLLVAAGDWQSIQYLLRYFSLDKRTNWPTNSHRVMLLKTR